MGSYDLFILSLCIHLVECLEYHILSSAELRGVKSEGYLNGAVRFLCDEGCVSCDLLAACLCGLLGRLVHKHAGYMIFCAGDQVLVLHGIDNRHSSTVGNLTISVLLIHGACLHLGKVYGLLLVFDIFVYKHFLAVGKHFFKCYYGLTGEVNAIESKLDDYAAVRRLGDEFLGGDDLLAIGKGGLAGHLIHKDAINSVRLSGDKVDELHFVKDRHFLVRIGLVASRIAVESGRSAVREVYGLVFIVDVLVDNDRGPCLELRINEFHSLKQDYAPASQAVSVDHEENIFASIFLFGSEDPLINFVAFGIDHLRFELCCFFAFFCGLEHHFSVDDIFVTGDQVLVEYAVPDGNVTLRLHSAVIRIRIRCCRMPVGKAHGLRLIIDVFVDDHFLTTVVDPLKDNYIFALEFGCAKHECQFQFTVLGFGCESHNAVGDRNLCAFRAFLEGGLCKLRRDFGGIDLPHHSSGNGIFRAGDEVLVCQRVDHGNFFIGHRNLIL